MMREHLTPNDIANQIGMERTLHDGPFIVVEGITDYRLYGKFIDDSSARIVIAHSRDNVERSVKECIRRKERRTIGIIDADLDILDGKRPSPPVFHTDRRDLEMMIIGSEALDGVLSEYGERERIESFEQEHGPIAEALVKASFPIGLLMHISKERDLGLSFKDLDFRVFVEGRTIALDIGRMVSEVLSVSKSPRASRKQVLGLLSDSIRYDGIDPWDAARGHDTVAILLICLKQRFGSYNSKGLSEDGLSGALRLAYSCDDFSATDLYRMTEEWAEAEGLRIWDLTGNRTVRS